MDPKDKARPMAFAEKLPSYKNPNCNHNSSSVVYQATFNHIKYGK